MSNDVTDDEILQLIYRYLKDVHLLSTAKCLQEETREVCFR